MVLRGDHKLVKIRLKPGLRSSARLIEGQINTIVLRASYHSEYNRKLLVPDGPLRTKTTSSANGKTFPPSWRRRHSQSSYVSEQK